MRPPAPRTIPPLLHPYTTLPPPTSLILLTSVLNASTNWLLLRFLCGALTSDEREGREKGREEAEKAREAYGEGEVKIVFVSFMREYEFWRREAGRCVCTYSSLPPSFLACLSEFAGWLGGWLGGYGYSGRRMTDEGFDVLMCWGRGVVGS